MKNEVYLSRPADYYKRQMESGGPRQLWFKRRQLITRKLVEKYWRGGVVLDLGCGNCLWSVNIPTVGVDISEPMLRHNKKTVNSFLPLKADVIEKLPFKDASVQTVVITEILEHIPAYPVFIAEIGRVLTEGGIVVVSVPYSKLPGIWGLIFPLWCKYKWWKDKDKYYLMQCGHKVNFSIRINVTI